MRLAIFVLFASVAVGILPQQGDCQTSAGYGAVVMDEANHRFGTSWNAPSQGAADNDALRACGGSGCKLAFRFGPNFCGAVAMPDNSGVWGGATRTTKESAALAAIEACQKRTKQQCKLRRAVCNGQPTTAARQSPPAETAANPRGNATDELIGRAVLSARTASEVFYQVCVRTKAEASRVVDIAKHLSWQTASQVMPPPNGAKIMGSWVASIGSVRFVIMSAQGFNPDPGHNRFENVCMYLDQDSTEPQFTEAVRAKSGLIKAQTNKPIEFLSDNGREIGNFTIMLIHPPQMFGIKQRIAVAVKAN